jgi:DNA topoisomerase-2
LLDIPGFLQQFITPIVKVTKGKKSETFFTIPQYEEWKEETGNNGKGWKIKYYKGLGTSTAADAKEYFSNLDLHEVEFERISLDVKEEEEVAVAIDPLEFDGQENEAKIVPDKAVSYGDGLIDMVFNKKRANDRKDWLQQFEKDTYLNYSDAQNGAGVKYSQFINEEYILFSKADCERSIPHVMDGFKPSQRKVLFACFKRKLKDEIKVAQLSGYIGEHSAYHHGEASLHTTIINMAQSFVGSNNINLLTPSGQFGTRRMGGKDAASPRYIFTMLEKVTRAIFHPDDDELLNYLNDDGVSIEPDYFMPVIPMVLVNGSDGIGTGWSSKIPNYDPRQIISNIRKMINGEPVEKMDPFYSGFTGEIKPEGDGKYSVHGIIKRADDETLIISELPVRGWTQDSKIALEKLLVSEKPGVSPEIKDFAENHTDTTVSFTITADKASIDKWEKLPKGGLYAKFKLISSTSTTNMHLFDNERKIVKYEQPENILESFFETRMEFYVKRKALLVKKLHQEQKMLSNKARFVDEVCNRTLVVSNRKKTELLKELQSSGYDLFDKTNNGSNHDSDEDEDEEDSTSTSDLSKGYDYLLGMKIMVSNH